MNQPRDEAKPGGETAGVPAPRDVWHGWLLSALGVGLITEPVSLPRQVRFLSIPREYLVELRSQPKQTTLARSYGELLGSVRVSSGEPLESDHFSAAVDVKSRPISPIPGIKLRTQHGDLCGYRC